MPRKAKKPIQSGAGSDPLGEAQKLVEQVVAMVGEVPSLTAKDRTRSIKLRKGGETVIPTVAALSDQFGLKVASYPTTTMAAKAKRAASLIPLHKTLVAATKQVADQIFSANSESWEAATAHYALLRRLSRTDGDLAEALVPVRQFFATRSPSLIKAEDAKTGHRRGAKATKVAAAPAAGEVATGGSGSAEPVTTTVASQTAAPAPIPVSAPITPPHA